MGLVGAPEYWHRRDYVYQNFRQTFSSLCLSCVKILPTSYMKKESLKKEKPCNVVLNIYLFIYIFFRFIYI